MMERFKQLCLAISAIQEEKELTEQFRRIADLLFRGYGVKCGEKCYRFAEVEFYYFRKGAFENDCNRVTYPRTKNCGEFFYHLSGVDICFDSDFTKPNAEFGGILIRSLVEDNERALVFGPLTCKNEMLNNCEHDMPVLYELDKEYECRLGATNRYGINLKDENVRKHCFFDERIGIDNWKRETKIYNYRKLEAGSRITRYKTDRFI